MALNRTLAMVGYLMDIEAGIFMALGQTLSPHFADASTLHRALTELTEKAQIPGYNSITAIILRLFEMPVSVYRSSDKFILDVFVHIPTYDRTEEIEMWERLPIPFLVSPEIAPTTIQQRISTVWEVASTSKIVGIYDQDRTKTIFTKEELEGCLKIMDSYFCFNIIRRTTTVRDECEIALYNGASQHIRDLCDITMRKIKETAIPVTNRKNCLFLEYQPLEIHCVRNVTKTEFRPSAGGLFELDLPPDVDCKINTRHHH